MSSTSARRYRTHQSHGSLPQLLLKSWLRGRWALLFSHPDDFASYGFEADRWLEQVRAAFDAESIAALAISGRPAGDDTGWIATIGGRCISHRTFGGIASHAGWRQCSEDEFQLAEGSFDQHFVMVLDAELKLRRTFLYSPTDQVPSPMSLASAAAVCRVRSQSQVYMNYACRMMARG
jgi:hypothetical protein